MCYFAHLNGNTFPFKTKHFSANVNAKNLYSGWASNCLFVTTQRKSKNVTKLRKKPKKIIS